MAQLPHLWPGESLLPVYVCVRFGATPTPAWLLRCPYHKGLGFLPSPDRTESGAAVRVPAEMRLQALLRLFRGYGG